MIIFQGPRHAAVAYKFMAGSWRKGPTLDGGKYALRQGFGPILIGLNLKDETLKMLELGGK